tara:strand:+ start:2111 stop:2419 length:309 start_codon:yes stop_codon:yes gene_type:complete
MSDNNSESWEKYQKVILKELQSLRFAQEKANDELVILRSEVHSLQSTKEFVGELKKVATLNQYGDVYKDVSMLKKFKIQATTAMIIVQFIFGLTLWYFNYTK